MSRKQQRRLQHAHICTSGLSAHNHPWFQPRAVRCTCHHSFLLARLLPGSNLHTSGCSITIPQRVETLRSRKRHNLLDCTCGLLPHQAGRLFASLLFRSPWSTAAVAVLVQLAPCIRSATSIRLVIGVFVQISHDRRVHACECPRQFNYTTATAVAAVSAAVVHV